MSGKPDQAIPENCRRLKNYFIDFLQRGEFPGLLVIVLDGLDQLTTSDGAHKLDWLPARVAPNIKVGKDRKSGHQYQMTTSIMLERDREK